MVELRTEKTKELQLQLRALMEKARDDGIRNRLDKIRFNAPDEDLGIYGPRTTKAVKQLQRALGLEVTGKDNDETRAKLTAEIVKTPDKTKTVDVAAELPKSPVTAAGKVLTQFMEGFGGVRYSCSTGFSTIGYGTSWENGMPTKVTPVEADKLMDKTLAQKYKVAKEKFGDSIDKLRPNERDAVMDLVYNLKPNSIGGSLTRAVKALADSQDDDPKRPALVDKVAERIMKYNKPNLHSRRTAEVMLLKGEYDQLTQRLKKWHGESVGVLNGELNKEQFQEVKNIKIPNFKENYSKPQNTAPSPQLPTQVDCNTLSTSTSPACAL